MVPPLPAPSRPSNTITTRRPFSFTHRCRWHISTCSLCSALSYFSRFIASSLFNPRVAASAMIEVRWCSDFLYVIESSRRRDEVELHAGILRGLHNPQQRREAGRLHAAAHVRFRQPFLDVAHSRIRIRPRGTTETTRLESGAEREEAKRVDKILSGSRGHAIERHCEPHHAAAPSTSRSIPHRRRSTRLSAAG